MIRRRAEAADTKTKIGNHSFRATGITAYLQERRNVERRPAAKGASTRTTQLYTGGATR
jgi:hypothetical protein